MALRERYDITIVTARMRRDLPPRSFLAGDIPVVRVGLGCPFDKWLYPFLAARVCARSRPQIVHAILESYAGAALILCRWFCPSAKRILTCQSTNTTRLLKLMHRAAHRVTAISSVLVTRAQSFGRSDIVLIPNGTPLRLIRAACVHDAKVPGRILFVGRLEPMKGVDVLIAAYANLLPLLREKTMLSIVGEGGERAALERLAQQQGIADRVRFSGSLSGSALYQQYAQAEIFCGLSRSEALGNVFLEAAAARCAIVAARIGGIPDIVEDGVSGLLVPADDPAAAKNALEKLLIDADFRQRLASVASLRAQDYDWAAIAQRYAEVYDELSTIRS